MAVQLPADAQGVAAGVLIYTVVALGCSAMLLTLTLVHGEGLSHVAMFAFFAGLSALIQIPRELNTMIRWLDISVEEFEYLSSNTGNPQLVVMGTSTGANLGMDYAQLYCWNVVCIEITFWSTELATSIYQMRTFQIFQHGNVGRYILKAIAILLPVLQIGLAQSHAVQGNQVAYFTLANGILSIGICSGAIMLAATLAKYILTRRELRSANSGPSLMPTSGCARVSSRRYISRQGLYDKWLLTRFTLAFVAFCGMGVALVLFQFLQGNSASGAVSPSTGPDFSADRAKALFLSFMPGLSVSVVFFMLFGTTKVYRDYMWSKIRRRTISDSMEESALTQPKLPPDSRTVFRRATPAGSLSSERHMLSSSDDCIILQQMERSVLPGADKEIAPPKAEVVAIHSLR